MLYNSKFHDRVPLNGIHTQHWNHNLQESLWVDLKCVAQPTVVEGGVAITASMSWVQGQTFFHGSWVFVAGQVEMDTSVDYELVADVGHLGQLQLQLGDGDEPVDEGMADMELVDEELVDMEKADKELVDEELIDRERVGKELRTDFFD